MEETNRIILNYFQNDITKIDLLNMFYDIGEFISKNNIDLIELNEIKKRINML